MRVDQITASVGEEWREWRYVPTDTAIGTEGPTFPWRRSWERAVSDQTRHEAEQGTGYLEERRVVEVAHTRVRVSR